MLENIRGTIGKGMELTAIYLLACASSIASIRKADECKSLGSLCVSVAGKEDSGDAAKSFEQIAEFLLLGQLGYLFITRC
jgi:hypothetical protein